MRKTQGEEYQNRRFGAIRGWLARKKRKGASPKLNNKNKSTKSKFIKVDNNFSSKNTPFKTKLRRNVNQLNKVTVTGIKKTLTGKSGLILGLAGLASYELIKNKDKLLAAKDRLLAKKEELQKQFIDKKDTIQRKIIDTKERVEETFTNPVELANTTIRNVKETKREGESTLRNIGVGTAIGAAAGFYLLSTMGNKEDEPLIDSTTAKKLKIRRGYEEKWYPRMPRIQVYSRPVDLNITFSRKKRVDPKKSQAAKEGWVTRRRRFNIFNKREPLPYRKVASELIDVREAVNQRVPINRSIVLSKKRNLLSKKQLTKIGLPLLGVGLTGYAGYKLLTRDKKSKRVEFPKLIKGFQDQKELKEKLATEIFNNKELNSKLEQVKQTANTFREELSTVRERNNNVLGLNEGLKRKIQDFKEITANIEREKEDLEKRYTVELEKTREDLNKAKDNLEKNYKSAVITLQKEKDDLQKEKDDLEDKYKTTKTTKEALSTAALLRVGLALGTGAAMLAYSPSEGDIKKFESLSSEEKRRLLKSLTPDQRKKLLNK